MARLAVFCILQGRGSERQGRGLRMPPRKGGKIETYSFPKCSARFNPNAALAEPALRTIRF